MSKNLTRDQLRDGFDAWVREARIPPGRRDHHLKTWKRAIKWKLQTSQAAAKVGYIPGHHEAGLQVELLDPSQVKDGTLLFTAPCTPSMPAVARAAEDPETALHLIDEARALFAAGHRDVALPLLQAVIDGTIAAGDQSGASVKVT